MAMSPAVEYETLASAMRFAKVVDTKEGAALLIAGKVYHVSGPDGNAALLFANAMRSGPQELSGQITAAQNTIVLDRRLDGVLVGAPS